MTEEFTIKLHRIILQHNCISGINYSSQENSLNEYKSITIRIRNAKFVCSTIEDLNEVENFCKTLTNQQ